MMCFPALPRLLRIPFLAALAAIAACAAHSAYEPPVVIRQVDPIFPLELSLDGISRGQSRILVEIDEDGRVRDWIPLHTSHRPLIDAIARVIDRWEFAPGREDGEPVLAAMELELRFNHQNLMVNLNAIEITNAFLASLRGEGPGHSYVVRFSELDDLPEPLEIVHPVIYAEIPPEDRQGEVELRFFIDPDGRPRLPVLTELEGDMRLALTAYQALLQWRFRPPTAAGRGVYIEAAQRFVFRGE